jgi:hypothetical protein
MFNKTVTMGWESKEIRRKCKPGSKKEMDPACFSASSNPTRPRKLREIQERFRSLSNLYCILYVCVDATKGVSASFWRFVTGSAHCSTLHVNLPWRAASTTRSNSSGMYVTFLSLRFRAIGNWKAKLLFVPGFYFVVSCPIVLVSDSVYDEVDVVRHDWRWRDGSDLVHGQLPNEQ